LTFFGLIFTILRLCLFSCFLSLLFGKKLTPPAGSRKKKHPFAEKQQSEAKFAGFRNLKAKSWLPRKVLVK